MTREKLDPVVKERRRVQRAGRKDADAIYHWEVRLHIIRRLNENRTVEEIAQELSLTPGQVRWEHTQNLIRYNKISRSREKTLEITRWNQQRREQSQRARANAATTARIRNGLRPAAVDHRPASAGSPEPAQAGDPVRDDRGDAEHQRGGGGRSWTLGPAFPQKGLRGRTGSGPPTAG